jgi:hypothetical protein
MTADDYTLAYGTHSTPEDGRCAMEWVSHLAGEPHSDAPTCVSPVLRAICITLNDGLPDAPRQRLRPYLARTIGTAGDGLDEARAWMAMDWLVRTYTPRWLRLAGLHTEADRLAGGAAVIDDASLQSSLGTLTDARQAARAARSDAFAAEGRGGRGPVSSWAAQVTTGRTGRDAAWACAGAAAGDAAAVAVRRLRDDDVCGRLSSADMLRTALGPTLAQLADSALALLDRMLVTEPIPIDGLDAPLRGAAVGAET